MPRVKGERRLEILKALAQMLEQPKWGKITTAALAEKLDVSEAALYRHFASKAQMYEGLIEFIENSVFTLANQIAQDETDGRKQAAKLVEMLLAFAEKNPGMVRVMTGDALVGEHERLQARMNQFYERFESTLKQALRAPGADGAQKHRTPTSPRTPGCWCAMRSAACTSTRSRGFTKKPTESYAAQRRLPRSLARRPAQAGSFFTRTVRHSECFASSSSSLPFERFARADEELRRFHRLQCADHAGERREHAHGRALHFLDLAVLRDRGRRSRARPAFAGRRPRPARRSGSRRRRRAVSCASRRRG